MAEASLNVRVRRLPENVSSMSRYYPVAGHPALAFPMEGEPTLTAPADDREHFDRGRAAAECQRAGLAALRPGPGRIRNEQAPFIRPDGVEVPSDPISIFGGNS